MSGETFLCEVCGLLIDWEYVNTLLRDEDRGDVIRWYFMRTKALDSGGSTYTKEWSSTHPSPHNHVPKLRKGEE